MEVNIVRLSRMMNRINLPTQGTINNVGHKNQPRYAIQSKLGFLSGRNVVYMKNRN